MMGRDGDITGGNRLLLQLNDLNCCSHLVVIWLCLQDLFWLVFSCSELSMV